jgi:hypothetical protein
MVFKLIDPQMWKPENDGDEIVGTLIRIEEGVGKYESKAYHIETEGEKQLSIFGSKVLDDKMSYVTVGDKIKIVYKGEVKGKESTYKNYEVYIDEPEDSENKSQEDENDTTI